MKSFIISSEKNIKISLENNFTCGKDKMELNIVSEDDKVFLDSESELKIDSDNVDAESMSVAFVGDKVEPAFPDSACIHKGTAAGQTKSTPPISMTIPVMVPIAIKGEISGEKTKKTKFKKGTPAVVGCEVKMEEHDYRHLNSNSPIYKAAYIPATSTLLPGFTVTIPDISSEKCQVVAVSGPQTVYCEGKLVAAKGKNLVNTGGTFPNSGKIKG